MLLIDGYNLLHVTRFKPRGHGDGELRQSREGLLAFLAEHLDAEAYPQVTIVFDSARSLPRPATVQWRHLEVHFARDHASADEMIEMLIRKNCTPEKLIVVSSDHRIQRAASRRRATPIDSDVWFDRLTETPREIPPPPPRSEKEESEASLAREDWVAFFGSPLTEEERDTAETEQPDQDSPFPPGYIDGLKDEFPDGT